jgi:hypothetical protein
MSDELPGYLLRSHRITAKQHAAAAAANDDEPVGLTWYLSTFHLLQH